jgi:hypothetical protein
MASATKWLEACNTALLCIGGKLIQNLDEASVEAQACKLFLGQARQELLTGHPWNCATRWKPLPLIAEAGKEGNPNWPYRYAFALPADCLRVLRLETGLPAGSPATECKPALPYLLAGLSDNEISPQVSTSERVALFCNEFQPLLCYIADLDNPGLWPPKLMAALIDLLATRLALPVAEAAERAQLFEKKYQQDLAAAMLIDAREGHEIIPRDDTYLRERTIMAGQ